MKNIFKREKKQYTTFILASSVIIFSIFYLTHLSFGQKSFSQSTTGNQSPAINANGDVTINYSDGISQESFNELIKILKEEDKVKELLRKIYEKNITIKQREAEVRSWVEKYKDLKAQTNLSTDILTTQAKEKLDIGDLEGAEKLFKQSLDRNLKVLSERKTAAAINAYELGLIKELQLNYQIAKSFYKQAMELEPHNSKYLNSYGHILLTLGYSQEAIKYYKKALFIDFKKCRRISKPQIVTDAIIKDYFNIASAWFRIGNYKNALKYYNKGFGIGNKTFLLPLMMKHNVANIFDNIALIWSGKGKYKTAIRYHKKALNIYLDIYGDKHLEVATCYNNLGLTYSYLGNLKEAMECYNKSLDILKLFKNKQTPYFATIYDNIGLIKQHLGKYGDALGFHKKALNIYLSFYGEKHPDVATCYNNLGLTYHNLGNLKEALEFHKKALNICLSFYGEKHHAVVACYNNLGSTYSDLGNLKEAMECYNKSLDILKLCENKQTPNFAAIYDNIGLIKQRLGKYGEALGFHKKALNIYLSFYGEKHPDVAICYDNLSLAYKGLSNYKEAVECCSRAYKILKDIDGDHPYTHVLKVNLDALIRAMKLSNK